MIPKKKQWSNVIMGAGQKHVLECPAHIDPQGDVIVAMELTADELKAIKKSKQIFLRICTYNQPMQPFAMWAVDEDDNYIPDPRLPEAEVEEKE